VTMEPLRALPAVVGSLQVHERRGGGQQQADAFRRALQQRAGDRADADANGSPNAGANAGTDAGGAAAPAPAAAPLPSGLQRQHPAGRKDDGKALHVDVIA
jgi:hypothetical protein